jgi:hypothetical protein
MPESKTLPYRNPEFWDAYRHMPAWEFRRFENHVEDGPAEPVRPRTLSPALELEDVESSLRWTKAFLAGLS